MREEGEKKCVVEELPKSLIRTEIVGKGEKEKINGLGCKYQK